ncbi:flagellar basal body rod protein FlgC [bacterium]|nr:flagellar basal body rod protein FlgC [bacterium]
MEIRGVFSSIDISSTGLAAQRKRMTAIAENIANVSTTRTPEGGPYKRKISYFETDKRKVNSVRTNTQGDRRLGVNYTHGNHLSPFHHKFHESRLLGVEYKQTQDTTTPDFVYDPSHPDANEYGYVAKPKINIITEMVDMISATRNYEANATAIEAAKGMAKRALEI